MGIGAGIGGGGGAAISRAIIRDTKTSGTQGPTATAAAWNTRHLTEISYDPDGLVSLASNVITMQAGTYHIVADFVAYSTSTTKLRLRDVTNTATVISGRSAFLATNVHGTVTLKGVITLTGETDLEIQCYAQSAGVFGNNAATGEVEEYGCLEIEKIA